MIERAILEAMAIRETVFELDAPDLILMADALLHGLGVEAVRRRGGDPGRRAGAEAALRAA